MARPRVLHVFKDYWPTPGGVERTIKLLVDGLRADFECTVLVNADGPRTRIDVQNDVTIVRAGTLGRIAMTPISPDFPRLFRRLRADLVHLHFPNPPGELSYLGLKRTIPMVLSYHNDLVPADLGRAALPAVAAPRAPTHPANPGGRPIDCRWLIRFEPGPPALHGRAVRDRHYRPEADRPDGTAGGTASSAEPVSDRPVRRPFQVAIGALAAAGSLIFAVDAGLRGGKVLSVLVLVALVGITAANSYRHAQGNPFIRILWAKENQDPLHTYDRWNAFSRITADGSPSDVGRPTGYGMSPTLPTDLAVPQMSMVIDGTAGTMITGYDGNDETTDFLRYDITNLGYYALEEANFDRSAVIGVGGGRDVLAGLEFGADHVTGIEINGNILDLITDELGDFTNLESDPRVNLVKDEARSWLTRTDQRFDVIQISLIDTWAATAAGAFALTENSLYTTDAWDVFFDRLEPGGMLSVSRWFHATFGAEPYETLRTASLASEVLTRHGVENPRDHVLIYEGAPGTYGASAATILVSPEPFTAQQLATTAENAARLGFRPILTPTKVGDQRFADIVAPGGPDAGLAQFDQDLSPPTDDRPFFFQMASLGTFLSGKGFSDDLVFRPVLVLGSLALAVLLLAAVCIGGPLVHMGRRTRHAGMAPFYLYFASIGLGFMLIEFSQLQHLNTFLGHPTYALAVVLFSLLLFSGIGSMLVEKVVDPGRPRSFLVPIGVLLGIIVLFRFITEPATDAMAGGTTFERVGTAVALLAPLALAMGMPFVIGMGIASRRAGAPTAFLWGINGAMSVVASVFGALLAMFFGINVTFGAGFVAYAVAALALVLIVRGLLRAPQEGAAVTPHRGVPDGDGQGDGDGAAEEATTTIGAERQDDGVRAPAKA